MSDFTVLYPFLFYYSFGRNITHPHTYPLSIAWVDALLGVRNPSGDFEDTTGRDTQSRITLFEPCLLLSSVAEP